MFRSRYVCGPSGQEDTGHAIPLLPELEQSFTAIVGSSDLGMEGIRRAMLASDSLEDASAILHSPLRDDPSLHYEAESMQLSDTADLCRMTQLKLQSTSDPILLDRHLGDDPHDHDVMYTDLTNHYREFSPGSTGDCGLEPELSDSSSEGSGLESPSSAVQWDTIAECAIDTEGPLPPVSDIFTHRISKQEEYGDPLYQHRSLSLPFLIKTERVDSEEDSLDCSLLSKQPSPLLSYATLQPHHPYLPHTLTPPPTLPPPTPTTNGCVNNPPMAPTTTTTNNSNYHDYTSAPREERPNIRMEEHSAKLGHFGNSTGEGEKAQRKKPGRKKGQVSKVLHLWEFIRDLLGDPNYCPRIISWENETEGVFRVLQSSEVARLWGEKKKNKKTMTYEKLSRSLRYSRKEGYFDDLPRDRGYPKKLCFKFGPKSHGWREYQR